MNEADNKQRARGVDSLLNSETVKYFSMEAWEVEKYKESVLDYQGTPEVYILHWEIPLPNPPPPQVVKE
jgi:ABC-type transport system involved in Fe-S cluster assembly fused permease/ATPase subunit